MTGGVSYRDEVKVNLMGGICVVESCLCVCVCVAFCVLCCATPHLLVYLFTTC